MAVSPAYQPNIFATTMDSIALLQTQTTWSSIRDDAPTLQNKLHWQQRLIDESRAGSTAIISTEYEEVYM